MTGVFNWQTYVCQPLKHKTDLGAG